jgi:pimeloyl-ACP methyl ester carboxylesterase
MPQTAETLLHHTVHRSDPDAAWVVLVHGAGVSSDIWAHQLEAYRARHNLLVPDLRGHGASPGAPGGVRTPYSWESVSRDVLNLMDHHGIASAHFVAVSMGTIVVRTLASIAPDRVRSMVLPGAITRLNPLARLLIATAHALKRVVPYMWLYRVNAWIILPRPSHAESRQVVIQQARQLGQAEFVRWLDLTHGLPARLGRYEAHDPGVPILYVMGDQDWMFLPGARAAARAHPSASLHVIDDCGHVCTVQHPALFNQISLSFLSPPPP